MSVIMAAPTPRAADDVARPPNICQEALSADETDGVTVSVMTRGAVNHFLHLAVKCACERERVPMLVNRHTCVCVCVRHLQHRRHSLWSCLTMQVFT